MSDRAAAWIATLLMTMLAGNEQASAQATDAQLKAGFPVQIMYELGTAQTGVALNTLLGNIDAAPDLEILFTAMSNGPLYALKSDGTTASGWPAGVPDRAAYPTLGKLSASSPGLQVFSTFYVAHEYDQGAYSGAGQVLPGWPRKSANFIRFPAALADVDGDGLDEIFVEEEDRRLHGYDAEGNVLLGWPTLDPATVPVGADACLGEAEQMRFTPAIVDLDGDGSLEIVTATGGIYSDDKQSVCVLAYHSNGLPVAGFPYDITGFSPGNQFVVAGDIDGDQEPEIVVTRGNPDYDPEGPSATSVISADGKLKHTWFLATRSVNSTAPTLADLDGDGVPELIVQSSNAIDVFYGDGSNFPGWPREFLETSYTGFVAVGDIDGDLQQDLVFYTFSGIHDGSLWAVNRFGEPLAGFPKTIRAGMAFAPAIGDIDHDGRNDIAIVGDLFIGDDYFQDTVWAYDYGGQSTGHIEWGQFNGSERHNGAYRQPRDPDFANSDLAIGVSQGSWTMTAGQPFTYVVTVSNTGPSAVARSSVSQLLFSGVTIVSGTASSGPCVQHATAITCPVAALAPGASEQITLTVTAPAAGSFRGKLSVTGQVNESDFSDNVKAVTVVVNPAPAGGGDPGGSGGGSGGGGGGDVTAEASTGGGSGSLTLEFLAFAMLLFLWKTQDWKRFARTPKLPPLGAHWRGREPENACRIGFA